MELAIEYEHRREGAQRLLEFESQAPSAALWATALKIIQTREHQGNDGRRTKKGHALLLLSMILYYVVKQTCVHHSCIIGFALVPSSK